MGSLSKKIRDTEDKERIKKMTGKTPKHRCPDCHRFTVWFNDGKSKHQCLMCELIRKEKEKVKEETI